MSAKDIVEVGDNSTRLKLEGILLFPYLGSYYQQRYCNFLQIVVQLFQKGQTTSHEQLLES